MTTPALHRFEQGGKRFVVDTETCFCFECDEISWAVLEHYPAAPVNRILNLAGELHPRREVEEVIGELEWLRATKAILPARTPQEQRAQFDLARDLHRVDLRVDAVSASALNDLMSGAVTLLLGRSGTRRDLLLQIYANSFSPEALVTPVKRAFRDARLAGKVLRIEVASPAGSALRTAPALAGHGLVTTLPLEGDDGVAERLQEFHRALGKSLAQLAGTGASVTLAPGDSRFSDGVAFLRSAGFTRIEIDLPEAYRSHSNLEPAAMLAGMHAAAVYYAQQLHAGNYFQLEPVASTFHQVYEGQAKPRSDDSGTRELAVDGRGDIYPSRYFLGLEAYRLGNLHEGQLDEERRGPFDDLGALTTSPCNQCWARNLCGGGHSAIHLALGGGIRTPDAAWCDSQREWFSSAIAAFNLLSANGVNFARLYANLQPAKKPSWWQVAKAAVTMKAGVRPIEEADAPLLTRWENWSGAAYFLANEYGTFLATRYDREMDSLHPRGIEQELVIVSRQGKPMGLLKIRPDARANLARIWVYLRDARQYGDSGLRRSFARILSEAARQDTFSTLLAVAGPEDPGLGDFLRALGFEHAGTERDALYLHDAYHPLEVFRLRLS